MTINVVIFEGGVMRRTPLLGLNYGPFRAGQAPGGPYPTAQEIRADLDLIAQKVMLIRLYSAQGISAAIVSEAGARGIQIILEAWIDGDTANNQREMDAAIALASAHPNVIAVFVGSEVLFREQLDAATLRGYLAYVRARVSVPVGYADDYPRWTAHPGLLDEVDWVGLDSYGYWNCQTPAQAAQFARDQWRQLRAQPGFAAKRVILSESGWPNSGSTPAACAAPIQTGEADQAQVIRDLRALAADEGIDLLIFEAADEPWKCGGGSEGETGCHWGLLDHNRMPWQAWKDLPDRR